jgi:DNA-binding MltR family transcriptional regulator
MSKALKTLSRTFPNTPSELAKIFQEMKSDSARGAVAAMSSLLEEALAEAIKRKLVPLGKEDLKALFEGDGPLSTFSARIRMGYALGIYGGKARRDLNLIREIRNAFVHSIRHLDFTTAEVAQLCATFHCRMAIADFDKDKPRDQFFQAATRVSLYVGREDLDPGWKQMVLSYPEYADDFPPQPSTDAPNYNGESS